jgi:hypothetical protein
MLTRPPPMLIICALTALGVETDSVEATARAGNTPQSRGSHVADLVAWLVSLLSSVNFFVSNSLTAP